MVHPATVSNTCLSSVMERHLASDFLIFPAMNEGFGWSSIGFVLSLELDRQIDVVKPALTLSTLPRSTHPTSWISENPVSLVNTSCSSCYF